MESINIDCQVFTPRNIVIEILNQVGYIEKLYGKKVLENSCGDGAFLVEIVDRYIVDCLKQNFSKDRIIYGLENDIYGNEIDRKHKANCIDNLNKVAQKYNINCVKWNIVQSDFLKSSISEKFDFIIGNPPYITYSDLNKTTRSFIKKNFIVCSDGKPDYYYAFIEMSIKALADDGKLAYLIPNNIFKNRFADRLRVFMLPHLSVIIDYTTEKLFENKLTSSAIIICNGSHHNNDIQYVDKVKNREIKLDKTNLTHKWIFKKKEVTKENKKRKFGDDFSAMCSIATLLNEVFILKNYEEYDKYILADGYKIEKAILREAVSPRSLQYARKEFLIFPYSYRENNSLLHFEESEFIQQFPGVSSYLKSFIERLNRRDKDKNSKWFEFGRSQALSHLNQEKLLLSTLITEEVKIHHIAKNQVPYSGICIYQKGDLSLDIAEKILKSDEFLNYVYDIGINASGTTMRITASDIKNFEYTLD